MVKKYVDGETKQQRKQRKALEKLAKLDQELDLFDVPYNANPLIKDKYYVLCLKHGTKYSADYVNRLYNMVMRNCTLDIEFVCLTDDPSNINNNVKILKLPDHLKGWWCKPFMFSNQLPLKGTILYMDLDVVIGSNIDRLFTFHKGKHCIIRDFTRKMRPQWKKYNSSVMRFEAGSLDKLWQDFDKNHVMYMRKYFGDQDWLFDASRSMPFTLYPDEWVQSWKWEIRKNKDLLYSMEKGSRKLRTVENVVPPNDCSICVFHGDPNPHNCDDPWVVENWK